MSTDGKVVVPLEPTDEQWDAADAAYCDALPSSLHGRQEWEIRFMAAIKAMSSPAPAAGVEGELVGRITAYLSGGGFFNPKLASHDAVRDLLIDCRAALAAPATPFGDTRKGCAQSVLCYSPTTGGITCTKCNSHAFHGEELKCKLHNGRPESATIRCPKCASATTVEFNYAQLVAAQPTEEI